MTIKIDATGQILIQDTKVDLKDLVPRLRAISENKTDTRIFLRGDRTLSYGEVMEVMARLNVAGFTRVAMITVLPKRGEKKN